MKRITSALLSAFLILTIIPTLAAAQAGSTAVASEREALMVRAAALRVRAHKFATIVAVLLVLTIMLMAAGHYV